MVDNMLACNIRINIIKWLRNLQAHGQAYFTFLALFTSHSFNIRKNNTLGTLFLLIVDILIILTF